jgi:hypothetical protein
MRKSDGFTARPLPGQAGYKVSQTEVLEQEAKEMEARLQMLQARMQQQQLEDLSVTKHGGSRWKSARTDKGSVTAYAKDVQERIKRHTESTGLGGFNATSFAKATAAARRQQRQENEQPPLQQQQQRQQQQQQQQQQRGGDFRGKVIDDWSVGDVRDWLEAVRLGQHSSSFEANEINGPILLEMTLEDLDYMGMSILGHRKVLLKGIEDLRQNRRVTISLAAANPGCSEQSQAPLTSKSLECLMDPLMRPAQGQGGLGRAHEAPPATLHWSHVEPLASNKVQPPSPRGGGRGGSGVNLADGDGSLDEAAEAAAFSDAVLEWRRGGGGRVKIEREGEGGGDAKKDGAAVSSSLARLSLSFGGPNFGDSGGDDSSWSLSSSTAHHHLLQDAERDRGAIKALHPSSDYLDGSGMLDEAAEQAEFMRAVEEWRSGGGKAEAKAGAGAGAGARAGAKAGPGGGVSGTSGRELAERLAKELEEEQATSQRALELQRREATQRLHAANRELEEARRARQASLAAPPVAECKDADFDDEDSPASAGDAGAGGGAFAARAARAEVGVSRSSTQDSADILDAFTPPLSPRDSFSGLEEGNVTVQARVGHDNDQGAKAGAEAKHARSPVSLSLVESSMGLGSRDDEAEDKMGYVVEEASDED